ncbi:MAG TPA: TadE family protein [Candidatus Limnocylindrales bacterium]
MRLIGHPGRRRRRDRGQALVEFALVIPIFILIVVAIAEFSILFTSFLAVGFASHDASQLAATLGNTTGADYAILQRVDSDVMAPASARRITEVDIYWVDPATGKAIGGAVNTWKYDGGSHLVTLPNGTTTTIPFVRTANGYPETSRCNVNKGVGCTSGHTSIDTIAVKIVYQYVWVTPFPGLVGGSSTGPLLTSINMMRLEPVR